MKLDHTFGRKSILTVALSLLMAGGIAQGATVPEGVTLADKQVLVRNNGSEPQSLDPNKIEGVPESQLSRDLFEGLTIIDPEGNVIPGSATEWEHDEFRVWRFTLRNEAKWSNGDPVTAHDFVYSWKRLADPNTASPYQSYLQYAHIDNIDGIIKGEQPAESLGIRAIDDKTFEITLSEAVPYIPKLVAHTALSPVHQKTVEAHGERWTQPQNFVGNGAYKLKNWVVNERIVLERNPEYWDNGQTIIDEVTFLPIASEVTDVNRYRSGEIDITYNNMPIELFQKLRTDLPNEVHIDPYLCTYYYEINNQVAPFDNPKVREALKLLLDRDIIVHKIKDQGDMPAYGFTPPFIAGMETDTPEWFTLDQKSRNQKAAKLLEEAGYSKRNPLNFNLLYNTSDLHKKLAIAASSMWKQNSGGLINVKLENQEWKTFLDSRHQGNYQVARAGWCADYNEPSSFLNIMLSHSSNNTAHYKSDDFDAVMAKSVRAETEAARAVIYKEAETVLDRDTAIVPVFYYANPRLVKPYVGGYTGKDPLGSTYTKNLYIIKH